ncbi:MAG: hypothetical protein MUO27_00040 [Sedimentisphaerales bacterium]|nr:hypothetical protein [Sedimentisphaerales bacterium]
MIRQGLVFFFSAPLAGLRLTMNMSPRFTSGIGLDIFPVDEFEVFRRAPIELRLGFIGFSEFILQPGFFGIGDKFFSGFSNKFTEAHLQLPADIGRFRKQILREINVFSDHFDFSLFCPF